MHRKRITFFLIAFAFTVFGGCNKSQGELLSLSEPDTEQGSETEVEAKNTIFVDVCGAVLYEGVYELPEGSRVYEAIAVAGGFTEDAAVTEINQAEVLQDETQLYVPTLDEAAKAQQKGDGKVNLNTATKEELMTLPGVGESKAGLIIQYREENGKFRSIEDVMNISGIKEGLFSKIKEYIKV